MKFFGRGITGLGLLLVGVLLVGCQTDESPKFDPIGTTNAVPGVIGTPSNSPDPSATLLHVGDVIGVSFADTPAPVSPMSDTIKDDGSVMLNYNEKFQAAGKTIGALQLEIHDRYVPKYFKYLTASVMTSSQFFTVYGEVRGPSRNAYVGKMTVLRAIAAVGGFTDFANKTKVRITRSNGQQIVENCKRALNHPDLDLEVFPGDIIDVPKRLW